MKFYYTIGRRDDGKYSHVDINLFRSTDTEASFPSPVLALTWQGDLETDYWYAFKASCEVELLSSGSRFADAGRLLGKLMYDNPPAVIESLAALGIERMVRDDRDDHNRWVKIADAKPADYKRYMSRGSDGNCVCSCIAQDEESAQKELEREYGKRIAERGYNNYGYADKLANWIASGRRVEVDYNRRSPDVRDIAEILKPRKEPMTAECC